MDWVIWDVSAVFAEARRLVTLLASSFTVVFQVFLVVLLVVSIVRGLHDYFGKGGIV